MRASGAPQPQRDVLVSWAQSQRAQTSIIAFSTDDWVATPQTRHHILRGLSGLGWPVTYSNGPHFVWELRQPKWASAAWLSRCGHSDGIRLSWAGRSLVRWPRFTRWDKCVRWQFCRSLSRHANWNRARHRIAYLFHPGFEPYLKELGRCTFVYHADDSFSKIPDWTEEYAVAECALVERSDLLIATSAGVRRNLPASGPHKANVLQNGAETEHFLKAPWNHVPADLRLIPSPRIGYCGAINPKVDLRLIDEVARLKPDWHWVLVGKSVDQQFINDPVSRDAYAKVYATVQNRPNIHFIGPRPYAEMPAYQAGMDVNVLCYRNDPGGWWTDVSPLKLYEYLSVGRPVVSVPLEVLEPVRNVVRIAAGAKEWIDALDQAIYEGGVGDFAQRREIALAHDWREIVATLDAWLVSTLNRVDLNS